MTVRPADKPPSRAFHFVFLLCFLALDFVQPGTHAEEIVVVDDSIADSTIVYPASFFTQYNPVSVNDMISRIPGVSISGGGRGGRGLGDGGNLLINGQRMAGKENNPRDQLSRIAATQVDRIEIIRGNSPELDVRSSGQIINIVLRESINRSSVAAEISTDRHSDGTLDHGGSVALSGRNNSLDYMFSMQADPRYNHDTRQEFGYNPDMSLKDTSEEHSIRDELGLQLSMNLGYRFTNDRIQFNGLYADSSHPSTIQRNISDYSTGLAAARHEREEVDALNYNWEIGGDYEHTFTNNSRNVFLFVINDENRDNVRERFQVRGVDADKSLFLETNRRTRERIVRNSYNWNLNETQGMQIGIERAHTILDSSLFVGAKSSNGSPSPRYGDLVPVLSASNPGSTVEEMRYEAFTTHNWELNERMRLESSLVYETSEISQSGLVSRSRSFDFYRPKLDYRFDLTSSLQLRASIERNVSQLSFGSFTASANNNDNDKTVNAGNPDLVQEKDISYQLNLEYRLPNDGGVLSSRFTYNDTKDVIGRVLVTNSAGVPVSATGNIGDGVRYGMHVNASTRLGFLGLPDAILSTNVNVFDSKITDPFLGIERRYNGRGGANIGFRHDITAWNLNYGFNYSTEFSGGVENIDIDTIERYERDPFLSFFISKVAFEDITFRLESMNTLNSRFCRERFRYAGMTSAGNVSEIEDSCNGSGQKVALKIRTTF